MVNTRRVPLVALFAVMMLAVCQAQVAEPGTTPQTNVGDERWVADRGGEDWGNAELPGVGDRHHDATSRSFVQTLTRTDVDRTHALRCIRSPT